MKLCTEGADRLDDRVATPATIGSFPFPETRGVDQSTASSSSSLESEDEMLKHIPSGDLEVPAPEEGVKDGAAGLSVLDLPPGGLEAAGLSSAGGGASSRRGGCGGSPITRDRSGHRRRWASGLVLERETRERESASTVYAA